MFSKVSDIIEHIISLKFRMIKAPSTEKWEELNAELERDKDELEKALKQVVSDYISELLPKGE